MDSNRGWLEGCGGLAEEAIVGVVAELVRLGEAFVARRRGAVATHDGREGVVCFLFQGYRVGSRSSSVYFCRRCTGSWWREVEVELRR
jgi:hypothetical protein